MKQSKIEEWKEKLSKDGLYLKRIKKNQTPELCEIAVKQDPWAIEFVQNQSLELCQLAIKCEPRTLSVIRHPTLELYQFAVGIERKVISIVPYNSETKEWLMEETLKDSTFVPFMDDQAEALQMVYLRTHTENARWIRERSLRVALEKVKGETLLLSSLYEENFEVMFETVRHCSEVWLEKALLDMKLTTEDKDELRLMANLHRSVSRLSSNHILELFEEKEELSGLFGYYYKGGLVRLSDEKKMTISSLIEEYELGLSLIPYPLKDYRLCRHATRLHEKSKWFSPYHALELLMEDRDY